MSRRSLPVILSEPQIARMEQWLRAGSTPQQVVLRAKIILWAAPGQSYQQIARELKLQRRTAGLWRRWVCEQGFGWSKVASSKNATPNIGIKNSCVFFGDWTANFQTRRSRM